MDRRTLLATIVLLSFVTPLSAQSNDQEWLARCRAGEYNDRPTACDVRVERIAVRELLTVRPGQNGGVQVIAADRKDIEVHARLQATSRSEADAREVLREVRLDLGKTITTTGPAGRNWSVSFVIYVPRETNLDLATRNGPLSVRNVVGSMALEAQNGPVSLHSVGGDVQARAQNGPLYVRLAGTRWQGAGLDAETRNGPLTLAIPEHYNAELETGTINGPMRTDFPLNVTFRGGDRWKRIKTTLGSGGPPVRVVTTNGPASLERP